MVPDEIQRSWNNWLKGMEKCPSISVPRSVVSKDVRRIDLHGFADASKLAVSAAVYALVFHHVAPVHQSLLVAKSTVGAYCSTHLEQIDESCEGSNGRSAS